jgi:hypothetical protein
MLKGPGPSNNVIVGSVLVISTDAMITTSKMATSGDWPQTSACWNISGLTKEIPSDSEITNMPQWQVMMKMMRSKGIQMLAMIFDEEENTDFGK